ncbi:putative cholestenol delta-isomerase [Talaromyces proteolyticus]|uniref:Cholestenol delta-isomerase n=1 Tax=Talaromyces proteolyticus TaxID=1131652 RepID=A0AAD4PSZ9_9EURO|nr:putative cholestenol delta-isomerase [Talaromyces proteolyticus]KAH8692321.1 putative cholestenol delta-isomerase [Talaromyces proteolyticus]
MSTSAPLHPYYPLGVHIPGYIENVNSVVTLIGQFAVLWAAVVGLAWVTIGFLRPGAKYADRLAFVWFCLTASIHLFFEGYFVVNHATLGGYSHLFAELWKEYSLSDSRYLRSDAFLVSMECITAVCWGPLGFFISYCIIVQHPVRYALQIVICLGQIYGDLLYFATSLFDLYHTGLEFSRPESYYFWMYYFFMNFIWIVIPGYYLRDAIGEVTTVFRKVNELEKTQKSR